MCGRVQSAFFITAVQDSCLSAPFPIALAELVYCLLHDVIWCVNICSSLFYDEHRNRR